MKTLTPEEFKKIYGESSLPVNTKLVNKESVDYLKPTKESISSLSTLYGGGEQGIANKIKQDVQAGASDIQKGGLLNTIKGVTKSGLRTAGDVAGAIFAPVGAAIGATGFGKATDYVADKLVNNSSLGNAITENKAVQNFSFAHPNAGEDFARALNLIFSKSEKGKIEPSTIIDRTKTQLTPEINVNKAGTVSKSIDQIRADKIKSGFEEQNARLKSADRSFNLNTKSYTSPDGKITKVTPIDTLAKYNVTPTVEKGTINMGDYKTSTGALGKIKEHVGSIDSEIDTKLSNSGKGMSIEEFKNKTIKQVMNDPTLKQSGKVTSTVSKLNSIFDDYKKSYGDVIQETEINAIRKVMNQDWNPDTVDVSHVIGDTARKIIYEVTPDSTIKNLLRQQGELLSAKKYAETVNGTKVTGGRLGNMAMRTGGAILGSTLHNMPVIGPLAGMIGGEYLARVMQQSQFKNLPAEAKEFIIKNFGSGSKSVSIKNKPTNN